jgi:hypothetical protein
MRAAHSQKAFFPNHAALPKLPELSGQITLRRSSTVAPPFSTLTLSDPLLTMKLHAG